MKGWHFLSDDKRLRFGDRQKVGLGQWIKAEGELVMCQNGMHASKRLIDALCYAPGSRICRVELRGELQHQDDKSVGRERRVEWWIDGEELLSDFARRCALDVVHLWDAPDVVVNYLKSGDESAAESAAWSAAWYAAWSAAGSAAESAAESAAWSAAGSAAGSAAESAAWSAAGSAQNRRLTSMVVVAHRRGA